MPELNCTTCAACCQSSMRPPFQDDEVEALPSMLKHEVQLSSRQEGACIWLADGVCAHNDVKPLSCRKFTPGSGKCSGMIRRYGRLDDGR